VSCRSDDEFNTKNGNSILEEKILEKTENKDSAKKSSDSLIIDQDLFVRSDSSKVEIIDNPPPVETTHWKNSK
jgi:hypothetical protein